MSDKELTNPELGELYTAAILASLYESWPEAKHLKADEITGIDYDVEAMFYDGGESPPREWEICRSLYVWLERNEFITSTYSGGGDAYTYLGAELTLRSYQAIKKTPNPLNPESEESLATALKGGAWKTGGKLAEIAVTTMFTAMLNQLAR